MIEITLKNENKDPEVIHTEGCVILYFDKDGSVKVSGKINTQAITPMISRVILERMSK